MHKFYVYLAGVCSVLVLAGCAPQVEQFAGDSPKLASLVGVREGNLIKANGQPGFLVYGPYIALKPGVYRLVAKGNLATAYKSLGVIDIVSDKGVTVLAVKPIVTGQAATGNIVSLAFEVTQPVTDAEFRLSITAQTTGSFSSYELTKLD